MLTGNSTIQITIDAGIGALLADMAGGEACSVSTVAENLIREALELHKEPSPMSGGDFLMSTADMDDFIQVAMDQAQRGEFVDPDEVWAELDQIIAEAKEKHG